MAQENYGPGAPDISSGRDRADEGVVIAARRSEMLLAVQRGGRMMTRAGVLLATGYAVRYALGRLRGERTYLLASADMFADGLQPFQDALPLRPIELAQERPQALNERVFEHRLAIRLGNEEAVQADPQRFGNLFERAKAGSHLPAFDPGQVRTRDARPSL